MPRLTTRAFLVYWLPVLVWLCVIATESFSALAASDNTSRIIIPLLHWLFPKLDPLQLVEIHHFLRKTGHFVGYGLLCYFFFRAWRGTHHVHAGTEDSLARGRASSGLPLDRSKYWRISWAVLAIICTVAVASADELHQMTLSSRTGTWWDVLLDSTGGLIFLVATYLVIRFRSRRRTVVHAKVGA